MPRVPSEGARPLDSPTSHRPTCSGPALKADQGEREKQAEGGALGNIAWTLLFSEPALFPAIDPKSPWLAEPTEL